MVHKNSVMSLGHTLKQLREDRGISTGDFCEKVGITDEELKLIENDQLDPQMSLLTKLAATLDVPMTRLFQFLDEECPDKEHECPISSCGTCIAEIIHNPDASPAVYGDEQLKLIKMADYIAVHGSDEVRRSLGVMLESLMTHSVKHPVS